MRKWVVLLVCTGSLRCVCAQKPVIDSSVYGKWPITFQPVPSNDGKYIMYFVGGSGLGKRTYGFREIDGHWKVEIPGMGPFGFTRDSRAAVFMKHGDSLGIVQLGRSEIVYISQVRSFKLPHAGSGEWLAYLSAKPGNDLELRNLRNGKERSIPDVIDYFFDEAGKTLLLEKNRGSWQELQWLDLRLDKPVTFWQGVKPRNFVSDADWTQLAFLAGGDSLWYYEVGAQSARLLSKDLRINKISGFSKDGRRLFFDAEAEAVTTPPKVPGVDIWSYSDPKLQSQQLMELEGREASGRRSTYTCAINIENGRVIRLNQENERLRGPEAGGVVLLEKMGSGDIENEWEWNPNALCAVYVENVTDGSRKLINGGLVDEIARSYSLSYGGKYVLYYDPKSKDYFSYTVSSGAVHNITRGVPAKWTSYARNDEPMSRLYRPIGIAGWLKDDAGVLLYDQHDIYEADPAGVLAPVNLTNGYGSAHDIVFHLTIDPSKGPLDPRTRLILSAFNEETKEEGFLSVQPDKLGDPVLLTMQPYSFCWTMDGERGEQFVRRGEWPVKAKDAEVYIVGRMSASESYNYYVTRDFKRFTALTDVHPEKSYNWLTAELINYKALDSTPSQGILYKPENFDPGKKYPLLFLYYERLSYGLHGFIEPRWSEATIDIPTYVSNGYLVFTPDIHYKLGYPGRSAYNSIMGAARQLMQMPYVDTGRMGINGHSFGGYETSYIVAHTGLFAAACAASGWSDFISAYASLKGDDGTNHQDYYETGRERIGATLWERPDLYIEGSPIFRADKVSTPLLMMNNKNDLDVAFFDGVQYFTVLRRLGKKVWMLQYDGEGHVLQSKKAQMDFTVRMQQFFDHYLKGAPAPEWMVKGVPARLKGVDMGLELREGPEAR